MKQLACEMCGSSDLIKSEGVFVCQNCGCKYSVDEAKKMMVEGVVEVTGTVSIETDGSVSNYIDLAETARNAGNRPQEEQYADAALSMDPHSWKAWLYKADSASSQIWTDRVNFHIEDDRFEEALGYFQKGIEELISSQEKADVPIPHIMNNVSEACMERALNRFVLCGAAFHSIPDDSHLRQIEECKTAYIDPCVSALQAIHAAADRPLHQMQPSSSKTLNNLSDEVSDRFDTDAKKGELYFVCAGALLKTIDGCYHDHLDTWKNARSLNEIEHEMKVIDNIRSLLRIANSYLLESSLYLYLLNSREESALLSKFKHHVCMCFGPMSYFDLFSGILTDATWRKEEIRKSPQYFQLLKNGNISYFFEDLLGLKEHQKREEMFCELEMSNVCREIKVSKARVEQIIDEEIERYWSKHPEKKEQLTSEMIAAKKEADDYDQQIISISKQIELAERRKSDPTPSQQKLEVLNAQLSDLQSQQASLGFFSRKKKKELDLLILSKEDEIDEFTKLADEEVSERNAEIDIELSPLKEQLNELKGGQKDAKSRHEVAASELERRGQTPFLLSDEVKRMAQRL